MTGIIGYGSYIPRLRLQRATVAGANAWLAPGLRAKGKGERAMANWDEDSITMAVEAARDIVGDDEDRSAIGALYFATTTAPFADRLNAGIVRAALTLEPGIGCFDITGSQRAALSALGMALGAARQGTKALVVAADRRRTRVASGQELDFGDGAAAMMVGEEDVLAELVGAAVDSVDFVDHFRAAAEAYDYYWEERWIRDEGFARLVPPTVERALRAAGIAPSAVDAFILPTALRGVAQNVAKAVGIPVAAVQDPLAGTVGDTGAGHGLLMLARALERAEPGQVIVVAQFGNGCEALVFRTTERISRWRPRRGVEGWLAERKEESNYLKYLVFNDLVEWDRGMRAEKDSKTALTTLHRAGDMILGLVGGRCRETGTVQFPRTRLSVSPNGSAADTQEPYKFAERAARIASWSADYLSYSVNPPNHYGMIDFDGGGRILMDIADVDPGEVDNGMKVRMAFRMKEQADRHGFVRYFWKAVPDRAPATADAAAA